MPDFVSRVRFGIATLMLGCAFPYFHSVLVNPGGVILTSSTGGNLAYTRTEFRDAAGKLVAFGSTSLLVENGCSII